MALEKSEEPERRCRRLPAPSRSRGAPQSWQRPLENSLPKAAWDAAPRQPPGDVSPLSPSARGEQQAEAPSLAGREGGESPGPDPAATKASLSSSHLVPVPSAAA